MLMIKKFDESENQYSHFWKKKNTHPDKRARVENDKFCVFVTVFVAVYLFVCLFVLFFGVYK